MSDTTSWLLNQIVSCFCYPRLKEWIGSTEGFDYIDIHNRELRLRQSKKPARYVRKGIPNFIVVSKASPASAKAFVARTSWDLGLIRGKTFTVIYLSFYNMAKATFYVTYLDIIHDVNSFYFNLMRRGACAQAVRGDRSPLSGLPWPLEQRWRSTSRQFHFIFISFIFICLFTYLLQNDIE